MKCLVLLLLIPFLTQCSSSYGSKPLATLSNPALATAWGSPQKSQTSGGYVMSYANPSNSKEKFTITATREMMPFFYYPPSIKGTPPRSGGRSQAGVSQKWNSTLVNGKVVKWYQSTFATASRPAIYRSMGVELANQTGGRGQYRIEAAGTKEQVRTWISGLKMAP